MWQFQVDVTMRTMILAEALNLPAEKAENAKILMTIDSLAKKKLECKGTYETMYQYLL
jgi:hypothetical protein